MKYIKLNKNWNAEPNTPEPKISTTEGEIVLSFFLNPFVFEHIDKDEIGRLEFNNVYAYRFDPTNDQEYRRGQFRFLNDQLPWGEFYELKDSKWDLNFPDDKIVLNDKINKKEIRHFIFFFRDNIFECLATDYQFIYDNHTTANLDEKYPKGYLNHYIAMFVSLFDKTSIDNFKTFTNLYIQMEGKPEFVALKAELKNIQKNNDLNLYLKYANSFVIENFGSKQLNEMIKVIENYI